MSVSKKKKKIVDSFKNDKQSYPNNNNNNNNNDKQLVTYRIVVNMGVKLIVDLKSQVGYMWWRLLEAWGGGFFC